MMTLISWVNRIYGSQGLATLPSKCQPNLKNHFLTGCRKLREMPGNTLKLSG